MAFIHFLSDTAEVPCGTAHPTVTDARDCQGEYDEMESQMAAELDAERRTERFFEEGTEAQWLQYRWEVEMDERNAAFWSGAFV